MSVETSVLAALVVITYAVMYISLPLHIRLLYVLNRPSTLVKLDNSFRTLMKHTITGNLIYSIVFCFIQAPAGAGIFFEFYVTLGSFISHIVLIMASPILLLGACFHLILAATRFTAVVFPAKHHQIWTHISYLCFGLWLLILLESIPLMLPGKTGYYTTISVFNTSAIQFYFDDFINLMYTVVGSFFALALEVTAIILYAVMIIKFNEFKLRGKKKKAEIRRMTMGVWRTTVAAMVASAGSWLIVLFFLLMYAFPQATGQALLNDIQYSSIFITLNAINNVVTPWGLLAAFPNVRARVFFKQ